MILGINWIDIAFFAILIGMVFKGSHAGVGSQLVSLVWMICLIFLTIGFYRFIASNVFGFIMAPWARALSFLLITVFLSILIKLLEVIFNIDKAEGLAPFERLGGAVIAALRSVLMFGLVSIQLMLLPVPVIYEAVVKESLSADYCIELDATIYSWLTYRVGFLDEKKVDLVLEDLEGSAGL